MKRNLIILLLLISCVAWGQDIAWKEYQLIDLSIDLPGDVRKLDTTISKGTTTMNTALLLTETDNYRFVISASKDRTFDIDDAASLRKNLNDVAKGFCTTGSQGIYDCKISDTTISKLDTRKVVISGSQGIIGITYLFIVNDHVYSLIVSLLFDDPASNAIMNKFIAGIDFNIKPAAAYKTKKPWIDPQRLGSIVGVVVVILLIVYFVRKNKKQAAA